MQIRLAKCFLKILLTQTHRVKEDRLTCTWRFNAIKQRQLVAVLLSSSRHFGFACLLLIHNLVCKDSFSVWS